jgi:hypothetical protein
MALKSRSKPLIVATTSLLALVLTSRVQAADLSWKGYDWNITDGGMAGVADGSSANIAVDANGYLHLHITKTGNTWTASEMFTTQKLGFGTYQWQIEGPIDVFDKQVVLGLFPYGPAAGIGGDGTNEIDIEFSRWGQANGVNADFTDYPDSGNVIGETSFKFSLGGGTSATTRFTWTKDSIESALLKGYQAPASDAELIKKWKYAPDNAGTNIPQQALPLGINLWCFGAPPSDGQNVEIVLRDFQFIKEGDPLPGGGNMGGAGGGGGVGGGGANAGGGANGGANAGGGANGGASNGGASNGNGNGGSGTSGAAVGGGPTSSGGSAPAAAGSGGAATAGGVSTTGGVSNPSAGSPSAGANNRNDVDGSDSSGSCACQLAGASRSASGWGAFAALALMALGRRRSAQFGRAVP